MKLHKLRQLTASTDTSFFDCGDEDLNDFLKSDALDNQEMWLSATQVLYDGSNLIGYFTMTGDTMHKERINEPDRVDGYPYSKYPCIKLARLAVDRRHQRKGVGTELRMYFFASAKEIVQLQGGRFITVDAKKAAVKFYESFGFIKITPQKTSDRIPMFVDFHNLCRVADQK